MTPFTADDRILCRDVGSLPQTVDAGFGRMLGNSEPSLANGKLAPHLADRLPHGECNGDGAERICGTTLRLEEVLERFQKEAVRSSFDTGRYRCRYFSWGSGPPLVFIHGLADDAISFVMPIARLSEHFRCICYDQPRGGADGAHLSRYHHADLVADLLALVDHLQLPSANLFGSSFGSTIALMALHKLPAQFPRAVLQGGFAHRPLANTEIMLASWARYWPWNMNVLPLRLTVMTHVHYAPFVGLQPELWQFFLDRDGAIPMEAVARRALILNHLDLRPLLPEIQQPILLVCGDRDPLVGKNCEAELMQGLPCVSRAELSGCGHMPQFTHAEVLAEATRRFLK